MKDPAETAARPAVIDPEEIIGYIDPEDAADGVLTPVKNWSPGYVLHGTPLPTDAEVVRRKDLDSGRWTPTI